MAVAVALSTVLAACGTSTTDAKSDGDAWTYVDARGQQISLDKIPERIVATADTAPVLLEYGVVPVGIIGFSRLDESTLNAFDFSGIAHVSETDTDISAEKLLAVDPDL
ncbi:MAG: ABC transporter substrate-binding protein, partial [Rhodococcus sp. (in: high G+C Gram-positive bacteria)]